MEWHFGLALTFCARFVLRSPQINSCFPGPQHRFLQGALSRPSGSSLAQVPAGHLLDRCPAMSGAKSGANSGAPSAASVHRANTTLRDMVRIAGDHDAR
jgi:hypothetical protein